MSEKHVLSTEHAEHVRHLIGNPIFAIETNLQTLKRRIVTDGGGVLDGLGLVASIEHSLEAIKARLHDLDVQASSEVKFEPFDADEEGGIVLMPLAEFKNGVDHNLFTNDDGTGFLVTTTLDNNSRTLESDQRISPSDIKSGKALPAWATHVAWYNK